MISLLLQAFLNSAENTLYNIISQVLSFVKVSILHFSPGWIIHKKRRIGRNQNHFPKEPVLCAECKNNSEKRGKASGFCVLFFRWGSGMM